MMMIQSPGNGRVLAEQLRPTRLEQIVGHAPQIDALRAQLRSSRIPHCFVLSGPTGCGKTTLARILSCMFASGEVDGNKNSNGVGRPPVAIPPTTPWNRLPVVHFINAANHNGIDDVRSIIDQLAYCPLPPWRAKIVVFDEAHQLTSAAQNALLTVTEDCPKHVYFIFCTTASTKLLPALRRRAYTVGLGLLSRNDTRELLNHAFDFVSRHLRDDNGRSSDIITANLDALADALSEHGLTNAGIVLQAAEKLFAGMPAEQAALTACSGEVPASFSGVSDQGLHLCRAVAAGNWKACCDVLRKQGGEIGRSDVYPLKACILGYLRKALLNMPAGRKSVSYARAISYIAGSASDEVSGPASLTAALALACEQLRPNQDVSP